VDDALLRPEPAQLRVSDDATPETAEVTDEIVYGRPDNMGSERVDGGGTQFRPRPMVKVRPWPDSPFGSSVSRTTYAAE